MVRWTEKARFRRSHPRNSESPAAPGCKKLPGVPPSPPSANASRRDILLGAALLLFAGLVAYHNSLGGPFVFDDALSIAENPTIRSLATAFTPPHGKGLTVEGRPLLNFSLALSYSLSGQAVAGYHALNLAIHLGAALALFGLVRRTLVRPSCDARLRATALPLAWATALLWVLHPLQTESVTYIVQRAESQMGLCLLLTLYCFVRGVDGQSREDKAPSRQRAEWWFAAAVGAALLGAATKEVAAAAPPLALLWDRTFVAGSFRNAWRARRRVYLGLFASWLLIAGLVAWTGNRGGTVGFGSQVAWWDYALTQFDAIAHYIGLALWPSPLIFDYGVEWKPSLLAVAPQALVVCAMVTGTAIAVMRRSAWGFPGVWFFAMLAPTSLIPGNRQTMAEHRMYLPLAAVIVTVVIALFLAIGGRRKVARWPGSVILFMALAVGLGWATVRRNDDYRTVVGLYRDTVAKRPGNAHAHYNLAKLLAESGAPAAAIPEYEAALRLMPAFPSAQFNLGNALSDLGRLADAAEAFRAALLLKPDYVKAHYNLGNSLVQLGRKDEAAEQFSAAAELAPDFFAARENLGSVLLDLGRLDEARAQFESILRARPDSAAAHFGLGNVLFLAGLNAEAVAEYERVLRLDPQFAPARTQLQRAQLPAQIAP